MTEVERTILCNVRPSDIPDTVESLMGTFGKLEREISALFILRLMRVKGRWDTFSKAELDAMEPQGEYAWNGLDRPEWIVKRPDGRYEVTAAFIVRAAGLAGEYRP